MDSNPGHNLLNTTLKSGWKVIEKITKSDNSTGAFFSVCYLVEKEGETCFLKAFDFAKFFQIRQDGKEVVDVMSDMISAYKYERDLSRLCKDRNVTKVSFVRDAGEEFLPGYSVSVVPYLIFDLADGDVRSKIDFSNNLDFTWKLKSLHDIAIGLKQLHSIEVSHQDLKPSNILLFQSESKLGDLGRSICRGIDGPYNDLKYSGDYSYAPPEIMYNYYVEDWNKRVFATDCYLLGSMVVFYFCGISMSALLMKNIPNNFRWEFWKGSFDEVKPYLADGFSKAMIEFASNIDNDFFKKELTLIVEQLCFPFPEKRGHPKNIEVGFNNFNLERYISRFNLLRERSQFSLINSGKLI